MDQPQLTLSIFGVVFAINHAFDCKCQDCNRNGTVIVHGAKEDLPMLMATYMANRDREQFSKTGDGKEETTLN